MVDLQTDILNTLNHNGHDEVRISNHNPSDESFVIRVGYWEQIDSSLIETMEEYHGIRITEDNWDDEDCGELFSYSVEIVEDGYSLSELMELESYNEENFGKWGIA
tara:strand:- start:243 stop:560 length:318 start_codon:yes stop_codon:yes gene_type:complete